MAVVPAMLLVILTILIFQLKSFQRVLLVLSVAPLGLIGVVAAVLRLVSGSANPLAPRARKRLKRTLCMPPGGIIGADTTIFINTLAIPKTMEA